MPGFKKRYLKHHTEGVQDDVMGERTSLQVDCHTCKMMDALFSALSESECGP